MSSHLHARKLANQQRAFTNCTSRAAGLTPYQRLRLDRGAVHLHRCGPRAIAEFLAQVSYTIGGLPAITEALDEHEELTPEMLRAVGGDRFPPRRPVVVPSAMRMAAQ